MQFTLSKESECFIKRKQLKVDMSLFSDSKSENKKSFYVANSLTNEFADKVFKEVYSSKANIKKRRKNKIMPYLNIFVKNIFTFFNMLLFSIFIVLILIRRIEDTLFFLIAVINSSIAIFQEIKAKLSINKLKLVDQQQVGVIRDDDLLIYVDKEKVVKGDICYLKAGDQILSDSIVLQSNVYVDESILTGESIEILKKPGSYLYAGSYVSSGHCFCIVNNVFSDSYVSDLEEKGKEYKKADSIIFNSLNKIIKVIALILIPLAIWAFFTNLDSAKQHGFIDTINIFNTQSAINEAISKTASSIVNMVPSGLFLLTSIALGKGVITLAKKKTMVSTLFSIEALSRVTTICFDKTGTLTHNKLEVKEINYFDKKDQNDNEKIFIAFIRSFMDKNLSLQAMLDYYKDKKSTLAVKDIIEFDSSKKQSSAIIKSCKYIMGAPEFLIDTNSKNKINSQLQNYKKEGYRVLLFAKEDKQKKIVPISFIVIEEQIRESSKKTIKWFYDNNVDIKIISGDSLETVSAIAKRCNIKEYNKACDLSKVSLEKLKSYVEKYTIFTRVSPEQKEMIVKILQDKGEFVGMTGDGANDLLALKRANCAISMGEGNQAAKSIADVTLLNNDFSTLDTVVLEGRRVINNIQTSSSLFLSRTFFTMIFTFIINIINLIPGYNVIYPFENHILYLVSFCGIGLPSFFLALKPNSSLIKKNFIRKMIFDAAPGSLAMLFVILFVVLLNTGSLLTVDHTQIDFNSSNPGMMSLIVISMLLVNLTLVVVISHPINKYTLTLILSLIGICLLYIFVLPYIINAIFTQKSAFEVIGVDFREFTFNMRMVLLANLVFIPGITFLFILLFRKVPDLIINKIKDKKLKAKSCN